MENPTEIWCPQNLQTSVRVKHNASVNCQFGGMTLRGGM